jgi:hypothetical protein
MYTAIANGCKGFTPFMYCAKWGYPSLRVAPNFVYETMALLEPLLLDPAPPLPARVTAPDDGVDVWIKRVGAQTVVIAVNLLERPIAATIACDGLRGVKQLQGLRQPTRAKPEDGVLKLAFEPYQVHLLCDPPMGAGLSTEADAEREIAALEAGLNNPANLLRGRDIEWTSSDTYIPDKSLTSLVDGWTDIFGWVNWTKPGLPQWVELRFAKAPPAFRTLKLHTVTLVDVDIQTRKGSDWTTLKEVRGNTANPIVVAFPEPASCATLRFVFLKTRPQTKAEVYEIEMLK